MVVPAVSIAAAIVLAVAVAVVVVVAATVPMSGVGGAGTGGAGVGGADSAGLRQAGVVRRWRLCVPCSAATHAATWWLGDLAWDPGVPAECSRNSLCGLIVKLLVVFLIDSILPPFANGHCWGGGFFFSRSLLFLST